MLDNRNTPADRPDESADQLLGSLGIDLDDEEEGEGLDELFEGDLEGLLGDLGAYVQRCWFSAVRAKQQHEKDLLQALRQRNGEYDPTTLAKIQELGGSDVYMLLTQTKCRATESWIMDILFPPGEVPFEVDEAEIPEIQPEHRQMIEQRVMAEVQEAMAMGILVDEAKIKQRIEDVATKLQERLQAFAKDRAERMQKHLETITEQGGWYEALEEFVSDITTYTAAFFKGPTRIREETMQWAMDDFGQAHPIVDNVVKRTYSCVSPFDAFPGSDSRKVGDGIFIERQRFRRKDLYRMIGAPGWDEDALRAVIHEYGDTGHRIDFHTDAERDQLEGRDYKEWNREHNIEAINFWGDVRGRWLLDWGMPPHLIPDADDDYKANVVMIGNYIVRAALNPHPLGKIPYYSEALERSNGQIWGKGVPHLIKDVQDMCNSTARAIQNNMALSSGPMLDAQIDRFAEGETVEPFHPWRIYQTIESKVGASARRAVEFFQPDSNAHNLMQVFEFFSNLADEYSGIPPYATGQGTGGGAADTATGMAMLQENAARGIKRGVKNIDRVIQGSIQFTFEDVMLYDDLPDAKGDVKIRAKASSAMINRERQAARKTEFLQATNNPTDQRIIGLMGRRKQLEDMLHSHDIDPHGIVPSEDDLKARLMQEQQAAMQQQAAEQGGEEGGGDAPEDQEQPQSHAGMQPPRPEQPPPPRA